MTGGNARSDYPTQTEYTDAHIKMIQTLTPTGKPFVSEDAALIPCEEYCGSGKCHIPDVRYGPPGRFQTLHIDGTVHDKWKQKQKDLRADDHISRMQGFLPPMRVTNDQVWENASGIALEMERRVYGR